MKVNDIGEDEYRAWKHHPVTKVFLTFLQDYRTALKADLVAQWEAGSLQPSHETEARGRALMLNEIATLEFEHIAKFYEPEESNAAQVTQDRTE